jgi:predicted small secreted protein
MQFACKFKEVRMKHGARYGATGLLLAIALLISAGSLLSGCNTVAGAGQDVSTIGNTVTSGANQTKRATGIP